MQDTTRDLDKDAGRTHGPPTTADTPQGGAMDFRALNPTPMDGTEGGQSRRPPSLSLEASPKADKHGVPNQQSPLVVAFDAESGIRVAPAVDEALLKKVCSWQGEGIYPGVDNWEVVEMPADTRLLGGLPGQSEYYSIEKSLQDVDADRQAYWESLQVKAHDLFGYRPRVGVYRLTSASKCAIAKTTANPQYGNGGAWQVFIDDFKSKLECIEEVALT